MSLITAFEVTEEDVDNVLRQNGARLTPAGKEIQADGIFSMLCRPDMERAAAAALDSGCDLFEQTAGAYKELAAILVERGILSPNGAERATFLYPKVIVLCHNSAGGPEFHSCAPEVTAAQFRLGVHYTLAKENAEYNDYSGQMIAFAEGDPAAKQLATLTGWMQS